MSLQIKAIKAFNDNYIWCLHNDSVCVVVDPGDAKPVLEYCHTHQLRLVSILITHHHWDHTQGIPELVVAFPEATVFGPHNPKIGLINQHLKQGDNAVVEELNIHFSVLEVPGHTLDHIAYYSDNILFCGDTLFSAGCGRLFEGTAIQMYDSLGKLASLPTDTLVYCTHEYTLANIKFALAVEPKHSGLLQYQRWAEEQIKQGLPTLPSTISQELMLNPFLRCNTAAVLHSLESHFKSQFKETESAFAALRRWKDQF